MGPVAVSDFALICDLFSYFSNSLLALLRLDCGWPAPRHVFLFQATQKGKVVYRHKRNFVMSASVMICKAATMTDEYVTCAREAAQKRYAEKDNNHRKEKAANKAYHTAHPLVVGRDGAAAGSSAAGASAEPGYAAVDMDNLMAIASRRGKATAATHEKNKDKLRAAFAYRGAGYSSTSAKILAAADQAGGLPALPDGGPRRGRDVLLGVDTPLKKIQTALSAHGAARSTSRALALAASPMRLRAPTASPGSRLVANGVVNTIDADQEPSATAQDAAVVRPAVNAAGLLNPSGVFDLFQKQYTIKDDAVYLGLVKKVLVEEGISGAVVIDEDTPVGELVGIFESTLKDANQWSFGHKRSLDILLRHCRKGVAL